MASEIAFVIGCARSGTSILGELIAAHPGVNYVFEAHEVWERGGLGVEGSHRLTAAHATPAVRQSIREWFDARREPRTLLVEKEPRNVLRVPYLRSLWPEARLIHIVRDGRDVACSMVPGCGGDDWSHLKPPAWRTLMGRYRGAVRCAWAWKEIIEIALHDLADVPHLTVRYEDLVRDPGSTSLSILAYLGLTAHPAVADFCRRVQDATRDSYHAAHQVHWYREDHAHRIGRWRENLNPDEQAEMATVLGPLLRRLGYA